MKTKKDTYFKGMTKVPKLKEGKENSPWHFAFDWILFNICNFQHFLVENVDCDEEKAGDDAGDDPHPCVAHPLPDRGLCGKVQGLCGERLCVVFA